MSACGECGARAAQGEPHGVGCSRKQPAFTVTISDIGRCPKMSLSPSHYRDDGTCLCDDEDDDQWRSCTATSATSPATTWLE